MINPLERLWKDKMDVYRWNEVIINGVTKSTQELKYSDIKCHYSKGSLTDVSPDGAPILINSHMLFCSLEVDLKEGDKVIVTQRHGQKITLSVGEGFQLSNHQEFRVKRDDAI